MSFKEKSIWVMLLAMLITVATYGLDRVDSGLAQGSVTGIAAAVIGFVVLAAIGHGVVAATSRGDGDRTDERDREVDRKTDMIGDGALSAVVIGILAYGMIQGDWLLAHIAFFGLFGAAMLKMVSMVVLYRMAS
ncbi:hypothetical protein [Parvularcula maris]|uniref:Uncharacterized protein n=1 Tax=Parvularcula maris TaxID=2965077 RepID=A0A9X2L6B9_9PROT|nr:hypothetical protein [Parvularcula maris]MCQ8183865.1 hypothetical protein [Parvularcula maris]